MNPKNIEEYVLDKVLKIVDESETKKDQRIKYLERILNIEHICHDSFCSYCGEFFIIKKCEENDRTHYHCDECYNLICFKCGDDRYCKPCKLFKERKNFVNSL